MYLQNHIISILLKDYIITYLTWKNPKQGQILKPWRRNPFLLWEIKLSYWIKRRLRRSCNLFHFEDQLHSSEKNKTWKHLVRELSLQERGRRKIESILLSSRWFSKIKYYSFEPEYHKADKQSNIWVLRWKIFWSFYQVL